MHDQRMKLVGEIKKHLATAKVPKTAPKSQALLAGTVDAPGTNKKIVLSQRKMAEVVAGGGGGKKPQ